MMSLICQIKRVADDRMRPAISYTARVASQFKPNRVKVTVGSDGRKKPTVFSLLHIVNDRAETYQAQVVEDRLVFSG